MELKESAREADKGELETYIIYARYVPYDNHIFIDYSLAGMCFFITKKTSYSIAVRVWMELYYTR